MEKKLFIPILLGTIRQNRESEKVAKYLLKRVAEHPEIETTLIDPKNMDLPPDDEGTTLKEKNSEYLSTIVKADGLIIISPEYNHGYPGSLKRVLDILFEEYLHKPVGFCGVSVGGFGGVRAIEQLIGVVRALGMPTIPVDLNFSKVGELFSEEGDIKDESYNKLVDKFLEELVWMAKTLRWGRENI